MEDIIQEISKIDLRVHSIREQSQERIAARRKYYEEKMHIYEEERVKEATEKGEAMYTHIIAAVEQQYKFEEERAQKLCVMIENKYLQVEEAVLQETFDMLFALGE